MFCCARLVPSVTSRVSCFGIFVINRMLKDDVIVHAFLKEITKLKEMFLFGCRMKLCDVIAVRCDTQMFLDSVADNTIDLLWQPR